MMTQAIELSRRPHIVIATPGRLVDHINSSTNAIHFKRIKYLVCFLIIFRFIRKYLII